MDSLLGILLIVSCAVSFSTLDVLRKKLALRYSPFRILTLLTGAQIPLYAIWYCFQLDAPLNFDAYASWGFFNIIVNLTANILIIAALRLAPLSNAIPLLALTPLFSLFFQPFFRFPVSTIQIIGGAVIFFGAIVLNGIPKLSQKKDLGLLYMTGAAFCCGLLILLDERSLRYGSLPFHGLVQTVGMTAFSLAAERLFKIPPEELKMSIREAPLKLWIGASVAAFAAGITQFGSLRYFEPGVVESVKRALVLFMSILFGFLFFKEALSKRKIIAVFLITLGIILCTHKA